MLSALRRRWDDSDSAAQLRYIGGWVGYGNPAQAYKELIYLFQGFVDLCQQHNIEYWLDWGSLLGYLRHEGGIIPWDYDHDVAMRTDEFHRFIAIVEKMKAEQAAANVAPAAAASSAAAAAAPPAPAPAAAAASPAAAVNSSCTFQLSDFTFERQGERGYYVMSLASHPHIQIDVVEYVTAREKDPETGVEREVLKHNMDDATYDGFFYPDYPVEWIFPLKQVNMLGWPCWIPRDSDKVTRSHFGSKYMDVLWVPYLLTKLYNPFLTRTLWGGPVRDVPVESSYLDAFRKHGTSSPFIVRAPPEFAHITQDFLTAFCAASNAEVFGYDGAGEMLEGLKVKDLVKAWEEDRLTAKVLDSPLDCCTLPEDFVALDEEPPATGEAAVNEQKEQVEAASASSSSSSSVTPGADASSSAATATATAGAPAPAAAAKPSNAGLSLLLTRANAYTFMHLDPPFYGGGWMYLAAGRKNWTYLHPKFIERLYDPATRRLRDLPVSELVTRFGYELHGQVLNGTAQAGDLVYFPPCWMHRVRTFEKCIGVAGYMKLRQAHPQMREYTELLGKKGLNSIWNGNTDI